MPLKVSEGENLETGEKQPLAKLRFAQFRTQSNKTYRTSSHGLGSPKTRLRDRGVAGVRRNPGGGVRDNRNFISASPSTPSPKSQISVYLPICFDFYGRFQILAVTCTYSVSNFSCLVRLSP